MSIFAKKDNENLFEITEIVIEKNCNRCNVSRLCDVTTHEQGELVKPGSALCITLRAENAPIKDN